MKSAKYTARGTQHSVSVPPDVKPWLKRRSKLNCRSVSKEILHILREKKEQESHSKEA